MTTERIRIRTETFIVVERGETRKSGIPNKWADTAKLPSGKIVHALDRSVFERAVKAAMRQSPSKKK